MDVTCNSLIAGTFEMPLTDCILRQCGTDSPITYEGPGLVSQDAKGNLKLRLFSPGLDPREALNRDWGRQLTPGKLLPDTEYYDFSGTDAHGKLWTATRLSIGVEFGTGTYIQAKLHRLETTGPATFVGTQTPSVRAFVPTDLELPWHLHTTYGEHSFKRDRFGHENDRFNWEAKKVDGGTWIYFHVKEGDLEPAFTRFWQALSILAGRSLQAVLLYSRIGNKETTRIVNRNIELEKAKLLPPISSMKPFDGHAHHFLECCLDKPEHGRLIYQHWHRILRARDNDIENCSLVLSVAIEGILKSALASDQDLDPEFVKEAKHAKPLLEKAGLQPRALQCVLSSLGNALRPRPMDILRRLEREGILQKKHLDAWSELRHAAAHGHTLVNDDLSDLQAHLDRFHICLDLFYRLMLSLVGYSGIHYDYSGAWWDRDFISPASIQATLPAEALEAIPSRSTDLVNSDNALRD